jgi:hypothetical protein
MNSDYFLNSINQLIFAMEMHCVFFEAEQNKLQEVELFFRR